MVNINLEPVQDAPRHCGSVLLVVSKPVNTTIFETNNQT